jgi:uncharacterized protein YjlB
MTTGKHNYIVERFYVKDDGTFPNSHFSALLYKDVLKIPKLFPAFAVKRSFKKNNWSNAWKSGIYDYHHYHSVTHEVLGVYEGKTTLQLGGPEGVKVIIEKGDVLIIPAGMAHKNLGAENDVKCVGAYPDGKNYDMNYGKPGERPQTDKNIAKVGIPSTDPVFGTVRGVQRLWGS